MFLAVAALGSCSYDSSEIEGSITELEQQIAALEQKAGNLEAQLKSVSDFTSGNLISRVGTDEKGNYVITYKTAGGEKKTVTLAKASDLSKAPMIGVAEEDGTMYWRLTKDNGASWEWILGKDGNKMPVATSVPEIGIDKNGVWTANGKSTGVLASDTTNSLFKSRSGSVHIDRRKQFLGRIQGSPRHHVLHTVIPRHRGLRYSRDRELHSYRHTRERCRGGLSYSL